MYKKIKTIHVDIYKEIYADGSILLRATEPLEPHHYRLTERLMHWAMVAPNRIFIGQKNKEGKWDTLTYSETFLSVKKVGQALLDRKLSKETPIAILSENSIEHAVLALACLHVGIPYSAISPAYSLRSNDFEKLKYIVEMLSPRLIFVSDAEKYSKALRSVAKNIEVVSCTEADIGVPTTNFDSLLSTTPTQAVASAFNSIEPGTMAKILFTSGSTGLPKGAINTHENISTNWQQITQTFPFIKESPPVFLDWLPWHHTFGGNHNFGFTINHGGSLFIDDGDPSPEGIIKTIANLKEISPTIYFNVPKGFEELIPHFNKDKLLCEKFFSQLKMLFYAGAGMPQHVWNAWEELSLKTIGEKIMIGTGLGCTESSPSALFASSPGGFAGWLGVPVPGLELKLVPSGGKWEARYRGKNIFPGYWKQPALTAAAFDEEGFYRTGDALKFVEPSDPNRGMIFDGRLTEDFKLSTGTWVHVGLLLSQLIAAGKGLIQDAVITGHQENFVGAIVFVGLEYCRKLSGLGMNASRQNLIEHPLVIQQLKHVLETMNKQNIGSSMLIKHAAFADFDLSLDRGEITDKGTINQGKVIENHPEALVKFYGH